jgi:phosphoribosylamine---glycine ligase
MRVLVIGGGGREHAIAWKLNQSPMVEQVFAAPGNPGIEEFGICLPIQVDQLEQLASAAEEHRIDLTVVGPEAPLAAGIVDLFQERNLRIAGPTSEAAQIESSKVWAKEIMNAAGVPTARAESYERFEDAREAVIDMPLPIVIKADGLAAGKGVVIAQSHNEAIDALHAMMIDRTLGDAAERVLLEDFLVGLEVSVLAITDGREVYPLLPSCDYKRAMDGDVGPNTGGVGSYCPVPSVDPEMMVEITRTILQPTIDEMRRRGVVYRGVIYAGLILTPDGPRVMEFNCRFGDPETQVQLPLMRSDLAELLDAAAEGDLSRVEPPQWRQGAAVSVVLSSSGYPGSYRTGVPIHGLDDLDDGAIAFHAGTTREADGSLVTAGGRVIALVALGGSIAEAREAAYLAVSKVEFRNMQFRRDIAERELEFEALSRPRL